MLAQHHAEQWRLGRILLSAGGQRDAGGLGVAGQQQFPVVTGLPDRKNDSAGVGLLDFINTTAHKLLLQFVGQCVNGDAV